MNVELIKLNSLRGSRDRAHSRVYSTKISGMPEPIKNSRRRGDMSDRQTLCQSTEQGPEKLKFVPRANSSNAVRTNVTLARVPYSKLQFSMRVANKSVSVIALCEKSQSTRSVCSIVRSLILLRTKSQTSSRQSSKRVSL